ncbi:MAG TPA: 3-oxoacyl-ACP reductase FabG [Burkholderiales bacterium]|nr:3-oxoacyl-ACP reductase FabG [Burkholderiales bacterium]
MPEQRTALVTGATRGIGQAIALELGRRGIAVIGTATSVQGAEAITASLRQAGLDGAGLVMDVTSADSVSSAIAAIQKDRGEIEILVNNAGIVKDDLLMRMKDADWDAVLDTNLTSVFRLSRAVLRSMMKARYGRIVNISSVVGSMGNAGQTNYAAAKAGMAGFSKSLAREVGSRNITVNCVAPGFIDTDMTRALPENARAALLEHIPLGRLGLVADIAHAVGFLVSDEAGYITGATLHVNGGMYME